MTRGLRTPHESHAAAPPSTISNRMFTVAHRGEVIWRPLELRQTVSVLHNPRYAGAYAFGRYRSKKLPDGHTKCQAVPRENWHAFIPDAHPGYIITEPIRKQAQHALRRPRHACVNNSVADGECGGGLTTS